MSFMPNAKWGANRKIKGAVTASERENVARNMMFSLPTFETPRAFSIIVGRNVNNGEDAARAVPIYAQVSCGVGRAAYKREIDVGPLNVLQLMADNVSVEVWPDERFIATDFECEVFVSAVEGFVGAPPATKSTVSLASETIAPAAEWLSNIPPGAESVSVLCQSTAQLLVGVGSAKNGVAITGTSGALGWRMPIPTGQAQLSIINAAAGAVIRPTLIYTVR